MTDCDDSAPAPMAPADPVEAALGAAVRLAVLAGKWDVVTELGRVLAERQRLRVAPEVASLEAERARRGAH
ncbi:MAG: hypothetical protein JW940_19245 [Polyangiaceae bacterium]|nr:hypothetical protein [Polyangiaceae bacterium]